MSTKIACESNGCIFLWKIVNISYCRIKNGASKMSPYFFVDPLHGTKWYLLLSPSKCENSLGICLGRSAGCNGPEVIDTVSYRIDLMDKNDESLTESYTENTKFKINQTGAWKMFEREKIYVTERQNFLPEDTLTICCTIWKAGETLLQPKHVSARTVFEVNRRTLAWKIPEISNVRLGVINKFKDKLMDFDLVFNDELGFGKKLAINCTKIYKEVKYFLFKMSVIDKEGRKEHLGSQEYFENDLKTEVLSILFCIKKVFENKQRYLENDSLTLDCECVFSTGTVLYEYCLDGIITSETQNGVVEKRNPIKKEEPQRTLALANDFKSMFNSKDFSDVELRTSTKTFPAHRLILIARSPVFRRMFNNDMKENNSGHVDIDDLEDDTIHRMLLYIYTDTLDDLQFENACKLYVAADKYEILSLRGLCSSFLKDSLCPTKACDILDLSDRHHDENLKHTVKDFILRHDEVFNSPEWKLLMTTNIQLAADVMYLKICPG